MHSNFKVILMLCLVWAVFAILSIVHVIRHSLIIYTSLLLVTTAFLFVFLYKLANQTKDTPKASNKIIDDVKSDQQIQIIETNIQNLKNELKSVQALLEKHVNIRAEELKTKMVQLSKSLTQTITAEQKIEPHQKTMNKLAHYDEVTTLPNRLFFNEILNKAINHAKRHKKIHAILLIDIDHFYETYTQYGVEFRNKILKELTNRLSKSLRLEDIVAKLDTDEFIILLNDIQKPKFASTVANKLLQISAEPITINAIEYKLTVSIGIAIFPNDGHSLEELLKNVDLALYSAKQKGATYQFFTHEMNVEAKNFLRIEQDLRQAIKNNELVLYYQPKLNLKKGKINGMESLMRWLHPNYGTINASEFIPIAEETGLIFQIDTWGLQQACKINKQWQNEGYEHLTVAYNLSPKMFYREDLIKIITDAIGQSGINAKYLELEINEKTIMDDIDKATIILDKLKKVGVQITLDHFGTSYTSISHLKLLPINAIKIDKMFIKGIPNNPNDVAIINAIIALTHHLGIEVIAEGVETAEQVQHLAMQNCDMVQGYYLSHPLPENKMLNQLNKLRDDVLL